SPALSTFCFSAVLRASRSPLFPYTTLFRSEADVLLQTGGVAGRGDLADRLAVVEDGEGVDHRPVVVGAQGVPAELEAHDGETVRSEEHTSETPVTFRSRMPSSA